MQPFDFQFRTRFVHGRASLSRLPELVAEFSPGRILLVCDDGIMTAGHGPHAIDALTDAGLRVETFHDFAENPTDAMVDAGVRFAREVKPDVLIGMGGGSSMDCCKGINLVYSGGGRIHDYAGVGKARGDLLPLIAVPTTGGTGSEAQSFAIISDAQTHVKMPCGDPLLAAAVAVLDPELTLTQPRGVTALSGIDAISHAIETHVTRQRTVMSMTFSRRAFGLLGRGFSKVLRQPDDLDGRQSMQLGACFAGMAIEASMLGAAHATANPLTARHGIVHGQAVGLMLPAVIRLNGRDPTIAGSYHDLVRDLDLVSEVDEAPDRLARCVERWVDEAGLVTRISDLGIDDLDVDALTADALKQWTGTFNPTELDESIVRSLYESAL